MVEGRNLRVRLVSNGPYNKALHSMCKGDVFLDILEVILFYTLNKVLLNCSLSNAGYVM